MKVSYTLSDNEGGNWQNWEILVDNVSVLTATGGQPPATTNTWYDGGTVHNIKVHCTSTSDVTKYDYDAEVNVGVECKIYDEFAILGDHFKDGDNTFDPNHNVTLVVYGKTNAPAATGSTDSITWSREPISVLSGDLRFQEKDLIVQCPGLALTLTRTYNSIQDHVGTLGNGWSHTYDWKIWQTNSVTGSPGNPVTNNWAIVRTGEGVEYNMRLINGVYAPPFDNNWKLTAVTNGYTLTLPAGLNYFFDSNGVLNVISNQWGNSLTLSYTNSYPSNLLTTVQHSNGQMLNFSYTSNGLLSQVSTPSTNLTASFSYDSLGELTNATQETSSGNLVSTYLYDTNSLVVSVITQRTDKVGSVFTYSYPVAWGWPTNGYGCGMATNLVVSSNYYKQTLEYCLSTNQYSATNRTVLTYQTRGTNQIYEYFYDTEKMRLLDERGPETATGTVSVGVSYVQDSGGNATNTTAYDRIAGESNSISALFDSFHNVTNMAVGYCSTPSNWWTSAWDTNYNLCTQVKDPDGTSRGFEYTNGLVGKIKIFCDASNSFDGTLSYTTNGLLSNLTNANGHWIQYYCGFSPM